MYNTLSYIGKILNDNNIVWAVGASILLNQFELVDSPNDIDILVVLNDIEKVDRILKSIGEKKTWKETTTYSTKYFYEYEVNKIDIDVMAGLAINHNDGVFEYTFDNDSISQIIKINEVDIPFTSMEDWYVIYQLIPNREPKVKMVEDYLFSNGIKKPFLLERALQGQLPVNVRGRINNMLSFYKLAK